MNLFKSWKGRSSLFSINLLKDESRFKEINIENDDMECKGYSIGYSVSSKAENLENWINKWFFDDDLKYWLEYFQRYKTIAILKNLWVDEGCQGSGIGKELLNNFIEKARKYNADTIILVADRTEEQREGFDLIDFYEDFGFELLEDIDLGDYYLMELILNKEYIAD